jgi:branched-chain amino acid transport system substrate-binding protein
MRRSVAKLLVVCSALVLAHSSVTAQTPGIQTIKIAVVDDFSAAVAEAANDQLNSFMMAADAINAKGGIGGRRIEVVKYDDSGDGQKAVSFARRASSEDHALALFGCSSAASCTQVVAISDSLKLPFVVGIGAVINYTTPTRPYVFRAGPHNGDDASALSNYVAKKGFKRPAIINSSNAYALDGGNAVESALKEIKIPAVSHVIYESQTPDVSPQAITLLGAKPDVVILYALPADGGRTVQTLRQVGYTGTIITSRIGLYDTFKNAAGPSGKGVIVFNTVDLEKPGVSEFFAQRDKRFGPRPRTMYVAIGYDVALVMLEGLKSPTVKQALDSGDIGKAREALRDSLEHIEHLEGLEGNPGSYYSFGPTKHHGLTGDWFSFLVINDKNELVPLRK